MWKSKNFNVHFDDGWKHEVIYQTFFWGDKSEILQRITFIYQVSGKIEILYLGLPYVFWEQQNCPELHRNEKFDYYFFRWVLFLEIAGTPINCA